MERQGIYNRVFSKAEKAVGYVAASTILFIMVVVTMDVVVRGITGRSIGWAFELTMLLVVAFVWSSLSHTQTQGKHIRVNLLVSKLSVRNQKLCQLIVLPVSLVLFSMFTYATGLGALTAISLRYVTGEAKIPSYPFFAILPLGGLFLCIRLVFQIIDIFKKRELVQPSDVLRAEL